MEDQARCGQASKVKILQRYLGGYLEKPSQRVKQSLSSVDVFSRTIIKERDYRQAVTFLLLKQGPVSYRVMTSYDLIQTFLSDEGGIFEIDSPVLILLVLSGEMENKRRSEIIFQLATERILKGRGLIIIHDGVLENKKTLVGVLGFKESGPACSKPTGGLDEF